MNRSKAPESIKDYLPSFPHEEGTTQQILVHLTDQEMKLLDKMQGTIYFDKKTGVKSYGNLWQKLKKNPKLVHQLFERAQQTGSHYLGDILGDFMQKVPVDVKSYGTEGREPETPAKEILEQQGRGGDTKIAFFPIGLAKFFIALQGGVKRNPKTGLLEFGFFDELIRGVGTVAGFMLGGPAGAGVGNAVGSAITGKSLKDSAISGLKNWGLGSVANMGLNALGNAGFSTLGQFGSNATAQAAAQTAGNAASNTAAQSVASQSSPVAEKGIIGSLTEAIPQPLKDGWGLIKAGAGMVKDVSPIAVPALMMLGAKREKAEQEKRYREELERRNVYNSFSPTAQMNRDAEDLFKRLKERRGYKKGGSVYAPPSSLRGGLLDGPGTGQSDSIKSKAPQYSYIIDASTVSDLGDGSSEAGGKKLKAFERSLEKKYGITSSQKKQKWPMVDVAVAKDEYEVSPLSVQALGGGNFKRGETGFRQLVNSVRKHKRVNPHQLPPKALTIREYLKRGGVKYA